MDSLDAIKTVEYNNLKYTVMPEDLDGQSFVVVDQYPKAGAKVDKGTVVYIYSE